MLAPSSSVLMGNSACSYRRVLASKSLLCAGGTSGALGHWTFACFENHSISKCWELRADFSKQGRAAGKAQEPYSDRLEEEQDLIWRRCWGDLGLILVNVRFGFSHFHSVFQVCYLHDSWGSYLLSGTKETFLLVTVVKSYCLNLFSGWSGH